MTHHFTLGDAKFMRHAIYYAGGENVTMPPLDFPIHNLEVNPCIDLGGCVEQLEPEDATEADFWSLYVHSCDHDYNVKNGSLFCIGDFKTEGQAINAFNVITEHLKLEN